MGDKLKNQQIDYDVEPAVTTVFAEPSAPADDIPKQHPLLSSIAVVTRKVWANPRRKLMAIVIVIVAVGVVIGSVLGILAIIHHDDLARQPKLSQAAVINNASGSLINRNYSSVQTIVARSKDPQSQLNLLLSALAYEDQNNYKQALSQFMVSEKMYGLDESLAVNIAYAERQLGDNKDAALYYEKAITILQSNNNSSNQQAISNLEAQIKTL